MKEAVIINLFSNIPALQCKPEIKIWAERLDADIAFKDLDLLDYDRIYLFHDQSLNRFENFAEDVVGRLYNIFDGVSNGAKLYSLDHNVNTLCYVEKLEAMPEETKEANAVDETFILRLKEILALAETFKMENLKLSKALIGDQHCHLFAGSDQAVYSVSGLEFLEIKNFTKFVKKTLGAKYEEITVCLGSNDINANFEYSAKEMADKYATLLIELGKKTGAKIYAAQTIPNNTEIDFAKQFEERLEDYFLEFDLIKFERKQ